MAARPRAQRRQWWPCPIASWREQTDLFPLYVSSAVAALKVQLSELALQSAPAPGQGSARMSKSFLPEATYSSPQIGSAYASPHNDWGQMSIRNLAVVYT